MSATASAPTVEGAFAAGPRPSADVWSVYRTERIKLQAQLATRLLAVVALVGPFAFAALLKVQSGTPSDALFGIWVHSSGFAISLVVLSFAGNWGFSLIAGLIAGDMFAAEDRHGTWKTVVTRSVDRRELFAGKVLAAVTFTTTLLLATALSSIVAGVRADRRPRLVNLSGVLLSSGRSLALVVTAWLLCVLPMLAYTSVAILLSVATRNGIVGVLGPSLVALATQLLDLIGKGVWAHLLLIGSAFDGWHALLTSHPFFGPLAVSSIVSVIWIAVCLGLAWRILARRDFVASSSSSAARGAGWIAPIRLVAVAIVVIAVLAVASGWGPPGVTSARLRASIGAEFNRITLLQQSLLGRRAPAGAAFDVVPSCNQHSNRNATGPGDWMCTLFVYLPQPGKVPFQQTPVEYEVSVASNGCYKAQSPPAFVGGQTMQDAQGDSVTNPLYVVYGCFNIL